MTQRSSLTAATAATRPTNVRLEQLVEQVRRRLITIADAGDSLQTVLDAMLAMASGVDLGRSLEQIMLAAVDLTGAGRGTLEVLSCDYTIPRFIHIGAEHAGETNHARIHVHASDTPRDDGHLVRLLNDATPVRLPDLGSHPETGGRPPGYRSTLSFVGVQVRVGDEMFGRLYLTDKRTDDAFTADDVVVVQTLAAVAGIAIQCRRRQLRLDAASEITTELLAGNPAEHVLPLVAKRAMELMRADATFITLIGSDPEDPDVDVTAYAGLTDEQVAALSAGGDEPAAAPLTGFGPVLRGALHSAGVEVGAIVALRLAGSEPFEPEERVLLESFVDQASIVLEVTAKQQAHRRLDVLSDRERIARDLHDRVIQRLFAAGLSLQGMLERIEDSDGRQRAEQIIDQLDETVHEIRTSIFDLHTPSELASTSLRRRLLDTVADVSDGTDLSPSTHMAGLIDTMVPDRLGDHADSVMREAITNVVRHSGATRLQVHVEATDELVLTVEDNGVGIPDQVERSGLRNMADRAELCGGSFETANLPGGGTRLRWRAPLSDRRRRGPTSPTLTGMTPAPSPAGATQQRGRRDTHPETVES